MAWRFCLLHQRALCYTHVNSGSLPCAPLCGDPLYHMLETPTFPSIELLESSKNQKVATLPTCGPPLILPPALKRWGHLRRQGMCSHLSHLWPTSDFAPSSEAVGTPQASGVV